jgi:hypothetical protein
VSPRMYRVHVVFMCCTLQRFDRIAKPLSVACIADVPSLNSRDGMSGLQNQIGVAISVMTRLIKKNRKFA